MSNNSISLQGIDFNQYIVIKQDDLQKHVSEQDRIDLARILKNIRISRDKFGKKTRNNYLIVNVDVDYVSEVINILRNNNHWK